MGAGADWSDVNRQISPEGKQRSCSEITAWSSAKLQYCPAARGECWSAADSGARREAYSVGDVNARRWGMSADLPSGAAAGCRSGGAWSSDGAVNC